MTRTHTRAHIHTHISADASACGEAPAGTGQTHSGGGGGVGRQMKFNKHSARAIRSHVRVFAARLQRVRATTTMSSSAVAMNECLVLCEYYFATFRLNCNHSAAAAVATVVVTGERTSALVFLIKN